MGSQMSVATAYTLLYQAFTDYKVRISFSPNKEEKRLPKTHHFYFCPNSQYTNIQLTDTGQVKPDQTPTDQV